MNRVCVITGAGSGIGRGVAVTLAKRGCTVVLNGRRKDALEETASLAKGSGKALVVPGDVGKADAVEALFRETVRACGRVDVLFNNAGMFGPKVLFEDITPEQWNDVVSINLTGAFLCAQAAFRAMKAQAPQGGQLRHC